MKKIERLRARLDEARNRQTQLYQQGKLIQGHRLDPVIADLNEQITQAERYEPHMLSELLPVEVMQREHLSELLVETHLAADYLADCAGTIRATMSKLGFADCSIFPILKEIETRAQQFANIVCHPEFAGLSDFMCNNEDYINAIHGFSRQYINNRLNITRS